MKSLVEILKEEPTDKLANGFGEFYEEFFRPIRHTALRILEIGIAQGGSLRAWKKYFTKADIYGLDIEANFVEAAREFRIRTFKIDAGNWGQLSGWACDQSFDVIIDDGSHNSNDIDCAFKILWSRCSGYYIIEDAQAPQARQIIDYFASFAFNTVLNGSVIENLMFRPNMIVMQKKC